MANSEELIGWLFSYAEKLELEIEHLTGLQAYFPDLVEIRLQIAIEQKIYVGWGCGSTEVLAVSKALSEAVERRVVAEYGLATTNGVAGHLTADLAAEAARNELLERDLFLCHYLTNSPFELCRSQDGYLEAFFQSMTANRLVA